MTLTKTKEIPQAKRQRKTNAESRDKTYHVLSTIEEYLLSLLLGNSLYGWQIKQAIKEASDGKREIESGSLYPTLMRLEDKGFLESYWENSNSQGETAERKGGSRRRYYKITPNGSEVLVQQQKIRENLLNWKPQFN